LVSFSSFFVSSTRDATATFEGYMRGLFQSERANMLRMSEVNEVDHQSMQHMLTEGCVDWQGFGRQIAQEANALLGGADAVLIFDESGFAKPVLSLSKGKARHLPALPGSGMAVWGKSITVRWVSSRPCAGATWQR
jgi:hypothetical protein